MSRSPIIGRFLKSPDGRMDGSTEYRAGDRKVTLSQGGNGMWHVAGQPGDWGWWAVKGHTYSRKAAIERIEELLTSQG